MAIKVGDIVNVKGYEELGLAQILAISTGLEHPYYIEFTGDSSDYDGVFSADQLEIHG